MPDSITEVTRRGIMDLFALLPVDWSGRLEEPDFLARLYPLRKLASNDYRFNDAYGDITQHRVNNPEDWADDYIFTDPRFDLLWGTDENLLNFLAMTLHPAARSEEDAASLAQQYNSILATDGFELRPDGMVSGKPLYKWFKLSPPKEIKSFGTPSSTARVGNTLTAHPVEHRRWDDSTISPAVGIQQDTGSQRSLTPPAKTEKIFIVHGHDDVAKTYVHHFLNQLTGNDAVILHEQGNSSQALIEKLEKAAEEIGYAVILLTPDDVGRAKTGKDLERRGRQNVIFEMGYFMALLGRDKVAVLHQSGVAEPGDIRGMLYIPFNSFSNDWKGKLAGELKNAGFKVDLTVLTK
ncbi:TIR domain-containing protein [Glutamicibacter creatinolyticus]|uniref:AbiJ-related protein n=1 Tax=Glutamicibacter creatinolyticus TaxID=162496 RepID=UPI003408116D